MRLTAVADLVCDESLLTGESAPVHKSPAPFRALPEVRRLHMAYAGTLVTRGRGRGVVTATGRNSEIGKIATDIGEDRYANWIIAYRSNRNSEAKPRRGKVSNHT